MFKQSQWPIISYCIRLADKEHHNKLQMVYGILQAYHTVMYIKSREIEVHDLMLVGSIMAPAKNYWFRQKDSKRSRILGHNVEKYVFQILDKQRDITPDEFYEGYMRILPFPVGNRAMGCILFNWLKGTMDKPTLPEACTELTKEQKARLKELEALIAAQREENGEGKIAVAESLKLLPACLPCP